MPAVTPNLIYDTAVLIQVVRNLKTAQSFLLDRFFPNVIMSDTEFVAIDVEIGKRRMAPFVSPLVEGKLVEQLRMQTNVFKPPYIKDKRAPDLRKPVKRMIGERLGGEMTGAEREAANIAKEMEDQIDILTRRLEWMAANALCTGTVTIDGDGYPTQLVDFGRDPSLTLALTSGYQWLPSNILTSTGTPGSVSPTGNIEVWQHNILKMSGAQVTDIIFTTSAWSAFILDPLLKGAIYYPRLGDVGNAVDPGPRIMKGATFKGIWGQYNLFVFNDWYVDVNNVQKMMIPDGTIIMSGPDLEGTRAFAQIVDPEFNYEALPFAPKVWTVKDPAQRMMMMQSSPIVIPSRANASMAITVCPAQVT